MTQPENEVTHPSMTIAKRMKELRQKKGWSAANLADACAEVGMPELNRSVIANIESRRRKNVTVEEVLTLAFVLDVSPLHLMVPIDEFAPGEKPYRLVGKNFALYDIRDWIRGRHPLPGQDSRMYFSEIPKQEFGRLFWQDETGRYIWKAEGDK